VLDQAIALHQQGRLAEAEILYRQVLAQNARQFRPHYQLGILFMHAGRFAEAVAMLERALALKDGDLATLVNLGMARRHMGNAAGALLPLDRAIALNPGIAETHYQRGAALHALGRLEEAGEAAGRAAALAPDHANALFLRALVLGELDRKPQARAAYDRLLQLKPDHLGGLNNRAALAWEAGDVAAALADHERLLALYPADAEIWTRHGTLLRALSRDREALASFDQALTRNPDHVTALAHRGYLHWVVDYRYEAAKADLARALALDPQQPWLEGELFYLKMQGCDWDGFAEGRASLEAGVATGRAVVKPFTWQAVSSDPASLQACARIVTAMEFPAQAPGQMTARVPGNESPRIRVGYVSADFREQATAYLMAGVYEAHDRERFEITAFDNGFDDGGPMRARLEHAFDRFVPIAALSDEAAVAAVRDAGIDILVNLNGWFGKPRMALFAHRAAPVQVNYLGFPGTLGAPYMDYILADAVVIPPGEEAFYTETVMRLPHSYQINDDRRGLLPAPSRAALGLPEGAFVFCHFNYSYKILPGMFASWMRILAAVPGSVLWLLNKNKLVQANLEKEAKKRGVEPSRIICAPMAPHADHLARQACADLFLDTLPYNAHTTASDALFMGVPVLTYAGRSFASRVCGSLAGAAGVPELVCDSPHAFVERAEQLGTERAELEQLKRRLAEGRETCTLFDTPLLVRELEGLYQQMYGEYATGQLPRPRFHNLPHYLEVGASLEPDREEMQAVEDYEERWRQRLFVRHRHRPLEPDGRLVTEALLQSWDG